MSPTATDTPASNQENPETDLTIQALRKTLTTEQVPLAARFRALFSLKHFACLKPPTSQTLPAIHSIAAAFTSPSALLKHELAYCLGQTKNDNAIPFLRAVLENKSEDAMCRHEAAEALGALADNGSIEIMMAMKNDEQEPEVVRETCDIAVDRIRWETSAARHAEKLRLSDFASIDPAPPLPLDSEVPSIDTLQDQLLDTSLPLFKRYRAMFALRDLASPPHLPTAEPAIQALSQGFTDPSALFRHEIAFVFGQLSHPASIPSLVSTLRNHDEVPMVRHEAAEALGSLGEEIGVTDILKDFLHDPEQVVRESVVVALDMAEYERSGETEYALIPQTAAA